MHPVDINEIIDEALRITEPRWSALLNESVPPIRVVRILPDIPAAPGNISELVEVFTNLILNAVDAMPDGGVLTLETTAAGDYIQAKVTDTEVAMDSEKATRVFEPFFTTKGPALGLASG